MAETVRLGGAAHGGYLAPLAAEWRPSSADFAAVLSALNRNPMTSTEIETSTRVEAPVVGEVLRVLAITGRIARRKDRYALRH